MIEGDSAVWQNASNWIRKIGDGHPSVLSIWNQLAGHADWHVRWRIACLIYADIPAFQSDSVFAVLRHDKSAKVRQRAIDRYENRPGQDRNVVFNMFDASDPMSPGFIRGN